MVPWCILKAQESSRAKSGIGQNSWLIIYPSWPWCSDARKPCLLSERERPVGHTAALISCVYKKCAWIFCLNCLVFATEILIRVTCVAPGVQASDRAFCFLTPCVLYLMMLRDSHMTTSSTLGGFPSDNREICQKLDESKCLWTTFLFLGCLFL